MSYLTLTPEKLSDWAAKQIVSGKKRWIRFRVVGEGDSTGIWCDECEIVPPKNEGSEDKTLDYMAYLRRRGGYEPEYLDDFRASLRRLVPALVVSAVEKDRSDFTSFCCEIISGTVQAANTLCVPDDASEQVLAIYELIETLRRNERLVIDNDLTLTVNFRSEDPYWVVNGFGTCISAYGPNPAEVMAVVQACYAPRS